MEADKNKDGVLEYEEFKNYNIMLTECFKKNNGFIM